MSLTVMAACLVTMHFITNSSIKGPICCNKREKPPSTSCCYGSYRPWVVTLLEPLQQAIVLNCDYWYAEKSICLVDDLFWGKKCASIPVWSVIITSLLIDTQMRDRWWRWSRKWNVSHSTFECWLINSSITRWRWLLILFLLRSVYRFVTFCFIFCT